MASYNLIFESKFFGRYTLNSISHWLNRFGQLTEHTATAKGFSALIWILQNLRNNAVFNNYLCSTEHTTMRFFFYFRRKDEFKTTKPIDRFKCPVSINMTCINTIISAISIVINDSARLRKTHGPYLFY